MNPLDRLIKEYVVPVARAAGFTKKARTLRLTADNGDQALLEFTPVNVDPDLVVFYLQFFIVPVPYWAWVHRQYMAAGAPAPDSSAAMVSCSVIPPREAARLPDAAGLFRSQWAFGAADSGEACGRALARTLAAETIPQMQRLLARQALLEEVRNPSLPLILRLDPERREIVLRIDSAPAEEIELLLARVDPTAPAKAAFEQWARGPLAERGDQGV